MLCGQFKGELQYNEVPLVDALPAPTRGSLVEEFIVPSAVGGRRSTPSFSHIQLFYFDGLHVFGEPPVSGGRVISKRQTVLEEFSLSDGSDVDLIGKQLCKRRHIDSLLVESP